MSTSLKEWIVIFVATAIGLMLFAHGLSYPLQVRVNGDALEYLHIADSLKDMSTIANYAGARAIGFPLFEKAIYHLISTQTASVFLLTWINSIGFAILLLHISASWLFSIWAKRNSLIKSENTRLILFFFLATFPTLIGHTTTPVSDTLSVDLVIFGLFYLDKSLHSIGFVTNILIACCSSLFFGYAVLVRPASLIALTAALLACSLVSMKGPPYSRVTLSAVLIVFATILTPSFINCSHKFDSFCLQSPQTFNAKLSSQAGLRGVRVLWTKPSEYSDSIPILADETMVRDYYQRCRISSIFGLTESSFTGCLISKPLILPVFLVKKWIGLFDYFRFTPYLEQGTPLRLRQLSRIYGAFAWVGFSLCLVATLRLTKRATWHRIREYLACNIGIVLLTLYSAILLAQHTVLHTEERYGFPLLPLCSVMVFTYGENLLLNFRNLSMRLLVGYIFICSVAVALYFSQITAWDQASSFALDNSIFVQSPK